MPASVVGMKPIGLFLGYLAVVAAPLALAWASGTPARGFRDEVASGLGLLAFAMILAEFVLSGRFRSVSGGIGLDATIRFHQLMARAALAAALLHPFAYGAPYAPAIAGDITRQHTLTADFSLLATGVVAFVLLPTFVLGAIVHRHLPYSYEAWRWMHGLGALLIAGLLLHHSVYAGRYSGQPALMGLWVALVAVAGASLAVVYIVKPLAQLRRPWRVTEINAETPSQWRVRIAPDGHDGLRYRAGQFVWLNLGHSPFSLAEHPFSISSAPNGGSPELEFLIKELGDFTSRIGSVPVGTRAYLDGPHGTLTLDRGVGVGLIAGGVGIAPLMGILRDLHARDDPRPVTLIYGNRTTEKIAYRQELDRLAAAGHVTVLHVLSEPPPRWDGATGLVDAALLRQAFDPAALATWDFVICGPPPMMTGVQHALMARGVTSDRLRCERFQYD